MHQLLIDLFLFLEPHLRKVELTDAIKKYYDGTLRVILMLVHDFPTFLSAYHLSFCNVIPGEFLCCLSYMDISSRVFDYPKTICLLTLSKPIFTLSVQKTTVCN